MSSKVLDRSDSRVAEKRDELRRFLPPLPVLEPAGSDIYQEVYVDGVLAYDNNDPTSGIWLKRFDFPRDFGPIGWFYPSFAVTLQYFGKAASPYVTYFSEWHYASYGRYSGSGVWTVDLTLRNGLTGLRRVNLGQQYINCAEERGVFQERTLPPPEGGSGAFPKEYFGLINAVSLHGYGSANSC